MLTLVPYHQAHLPALLPLLPAAQEPGSLGKDLGDFARGHGTQVAVAVRDGEPCGVVGWVTFGVEAEGIVYGVPLLAGTEAAARLLLEHLIGIARGLEARQLRVSRFPGEAAKEAALRGVGFRPLLDILSVEGPISGLPAGVMPRELERIPMPEVDWERFAQASNRAFADVPNTPPLDARALRLEWEALDPEASQIWRDPAGRYLAWLGAHPHGHVEVVGVEESLRGRGVAPAMYRTAAEALAARGVTRLRAELASTNGATLRLHEKLGFREYTRRQVFALELQERLRPA